MVMHRRVSFGSWIEFRIDKLLSSHNVSQWYHILGEHCVSHAIRLSNLEHVFFVKVNMDHLP